ncbi:MAG: GtrA family protein [Ruminococcaceae bacterium]|nr:GtrA family protein [Oscillospiraceae bacterium]
MKNKKEIIMYIVFGALTTLVSWGTYIFFENALHFSVFWSNLLSWICAVTFAYITNKLWVFDSKSFEFKVLIKEITTFIASRGITGIFEIAFVPLLARLGFDNPFFAAVKGLNIKADIFYTSGVYSKISVAIVVVILNYVLSKLIVFKKDKE